VTYLLKVNKTMAEIQPLFVSINQARKRGASDEAILARIGVSKPDMTSSISAAQKKGLSAKEILDDIKKQSAQKNLASSQAASKEAEKGYSNKPGALIQQVAATPPVQTAGKFGIGVLKGLGQTADLASMAGQNVANWTINKLPGMGGQQPIAQLPEQVTRTSGDIEGAGAFASGFIPLGMGAKAVAKGVQVARETPATLRKAAEMLLNPASKEIPKLAAKGTAGTGIRVSKSLGGLLEQAVVEPTERAVQLAKSTGKLIVNDWKRSIDNLYTENQKVYSKVGDWLKTQRINGGAYKEYTPESLSALKKKIMAIKPESYFARKEVSAKNSAESVKMWAIDQLKKLNPTDSPEMWKTRSLMDNMVEGQYPTKDILSGQARNTAIEVYKKIRQIINEDIGTVDGKLPKFAGKTFQDWLRYEHDLYEAAQTLAEKYGKGIRVPEAAKKAVTTGQLIRQYGPIAGGGAIGGAILAKLGELLNLGGE
jgi:hypothetical protein